MKNCGRVFLSIDYESIWNEEAIRADNTVAVHIRHIREKIEINPKDKIFESCLGRRLQNRKTISIRIIVGGSYGK